jgi:hypothetical protein
LIERFELHAKVAQDAENLTRLFMKEPCTRNNHRSFELRFENRVDSTTAAAVVVVAVLLVALRIAAGRAITIARLSVRDGKIEVVRGGIVPPVLADLRDIASRPPIARLEIDIVRSSGRAEVSLHGDVSAEQAQRLRNVIGSVPLARLVNAARR